MIINGTPLFLDWIKSRKFWDRLVTVKDDESRMKRKLDKLLYVFISSQIRINCGKSLSQANYLYLMVEAYKSSVDTESLVYPLLYLDPFDLD